MEETDSFELIINYYFNKQSKIFSL